jgi:hypothetical protein
VLLVLGGGGSLVDGSGGLVVCVGAVVVGATEVDVSGGLVAGGDVGAVVEAGAGPAPGSAGVVGVGVWGAPGAPLGGSSGGFTAGAWLTAS